MRFFQLLVLVMIMIQSVHAEKVNLSKIANDIDNDSFYSLQLNISPATSKIEELIVSMIAKKSGKVLEKFTFKVANLRTGITLHEVKNIPVVKLIGKAFDFLEGGKLRLVYLTNGISKSYAELQLELVKDTTGKWNLYRLDEERGLSSKHIIEIFFKSRKLFPIGVIGIKNVSFKFGEV